jgi:hydroxyethylthiazole kinase-like uncharacterized protein yjeF
MKLVTSAQMQAVDRRAIDGLGVPGIDLMENAGHEIAQAIARIHDDDIREMRVAVVSGKGNNGGDGFVVARHLHDWGADLHIFTLANPDDYKADALENLRRVRELNLPITWINEEIENLELEDFDIVVDAIFGTGFRGAVREPIASVIEYLNELDIPVVAVDTPSGLNNDTGEVEGACVWADMTVSLALPKIGQYFYPGRAQCGLIRIVDISMPLEALAEADSDVHLITAPMVSEIIPDREPTSHKGNCGKVFVLGGSVGMTGAVTLAAESAVRSGSGLVYAGSPTSLNDILEVKLTEALTKPLPELRKARALPVRALGPIIENIRAVDACCLGPGVGRHFETIELFRRLIPNLDKPAVLDADGLFPFSEKPELLKECTAPLVLTPHAGEFARLSGKKLPARQIECFEPLREYSRLIDKVVLLKGAPTLICSPEGEIYVSPTGNPGMATGGSGDVLTGVIGSLLGLGLSALDAAICGAYIHGMAGDLAHAEVGTFGLTASNIIEYLPEVFLRLKVDNYGTFL